MSIIGISRCLIFKFVCLEKKIGIFPQVFFKFGFKSPMTLLVDGSGGCGRTHKKFGLHDL